MISSDIFCTREQLLHRPGSKLGFVIYHLIYEDETEWARFMDHLNSYTHKQLESSCDSDIFAHVDWSIKDDPKLQDLNPDKVRM